MTLPTKATLNTRLPPKAKLSLIQSLTTLPPKLTQPTTLPPKLTTFLLLLIALFLNKNFAFKSESLNYMNNNLYFRRNTYNTLLNLTNLNNNVNTTIFSILVSGMAYTPDVFFPSNDAIQSLYLNNIENYSSVFDKPMPVFHMTIRAFFPFMFLFLITLDNWLTETFSFCHMSIKLKYLFLESRNASINNACASFYRKCFYFTNQCFAVADIIRSDCIKEQFPLYVLSKLNFSKRYWDFKYLLILSGDINLHPGPIQYPCYVCAKPVRKRSVSL